MSKKSVVAFSMWLASLPLFATPPASRVLQEVVTDGGGWRIELADYGEPTRFELWSTRISPPGPRIRISQETTGQGWDVATGFVVIQSNRTWRAVYELDHVAYGVHDLYAVDIDGGRRALVYRLVLPGYVRFGTDKVTFAAEIIAGGAESWWISDTVGAEREVLFADGFESSDTGRWR